MSGWVGGEPWGLSGDPRVLDLTTMTWTPRSATEGGPALAVTEEEEEEEEEEKESVPAAAIAGAAAAVAQNRFVYVFGGAERSRATTIKDASSAAVKAAAPADLFPVMSVRCLDLDMDQDEEDEDDDEDEDEDEDDDDEKKAKKADAAVMEWMDVSAAVPDEPYVGGDRPLTTTV